MNNCDIDNWPSDQDSNEFILSILVIEIMQTSEPNLKAKRTQKLEQLWNQGKIKIIGDCQALDKPARPQSVQIVPPSHTPNRANKISMLHSLVHIENWAIDLSLDILVRFNSQHTLPHSFFTEWIRIAAEEAKHYTILCNRLIEQGSYYGALPAHDGLWESAMETQHSLLARLAIEHMVHEARGLDVNPKTVARFRSSGDKQTAELIEIIFKDEITHVAAGLRWFQYLCLQSNPPLNPIEEFHNIVKSHFKGSLKPPFNEEARTAAGMTPEWYLPLTAIKVNSKK
eukprot:TRINITY_DN3438_c0_g1_i2.p1 TRINITY_DN3438_c0_g1~~TRINITY_DN3438_c0_g1_i2.p1  ORF type:complete len:285 (+),score=98.34 TRINITY_DN3438_c0_g1_i2:151-1005(+)